MSQRSTPRLGGKHGASGRSAHHRTARPPSGLGDKKSHTHPEGKTQSGEEALTSWRGSQREGRAAAADVARRPQRNAPQRSGPPSASCRHRRPAQAEEGALPTQQQAAEAASQRLLGSRRCSQLCPAAHPARPRQRKPGCWTSLRRSSPCAQTPRCCCCGSSGGRSGGRGQTLTTAQRAALRTPSRRRQLTSGSRFPRAPAGAGGGSRRRRSPHRS